MSLRLRLLVIIGLLGSGTAILLAQSALRAWSAAEAARDRREVSQDARRLADAAGHFAVERGEINGALVSRDRAALDRALARRARGEALLAEALSQMAAPHLAAPHLAAPHLAAPLATWRTAHGNLQAARSTAEAAIAGSTPPGPWFTVASAQIDALTALRRALETNLAEDRAGRLVGLRDALVEATEFAGRERGLVNGLIATGRPLTPEQILALGALRGRIEGAGTRVTALLSGMPEGVSAAVQPAMEAYFSRFEAERAAVIAALLHGQPPPLNPAAWFRAATQGIEALIAAQGQVSNTLEADFGAAARAASWHAVVLGGLLLLGLALILLGLSYVEWRIARPLREAMGAILRLADGDNETPVPAGRGNDEVAGLLTATARFQETARANQRMQAQQEELRRNADAARGDTLREMAELIEHETGRVMESVQARADVLGNLSMDMREAMAAIASGTSIATEAAQAAASRLGEAAEGGRAMGEAAENITAQMRQASQSTEAAVSRAEQARGAFIALDSTVTQIGEVSRLIGDIASRTNLLALNATIEAARAGDAGKGFAVVAGEVKSLANQTARSTAEISGRITALTAGAEQATAALQSIQGSVEDLSRVNARVGEAAERQSATTVVISRAVLDGDGEARALAEQMQAIAGQAKAADGKASGLASAAQEVAGEVRSLRGALVAMVRERFDELERRREPRQAVNMQASLLTGGGSVEGQVRDWAPHGVFFATTASFQGDEVTLRLMGQKDRRMRVVRRAAEGVGLAEIMTQHAQAA